MGLVNSYEIRFILLLSLLTITSIEAINDICVDLHEYETKNFGRSKYDNATEVISFIDSWSPPHIFHFSSKICGPFAKLLVELSRQYGYSIKRIPYPRDRIRLFETLQSNQWSVTLFPIIPSIYETGLELHLGETTVLSRPLGIKSDGHILSKIRPGKRNIFEFIQGFETPVWIVLLLTIVFIPFALALVKKTLSDYMTDLWNYSCLILSEVIPRFPASSTQRFIISFWLLGCTVLLAGYAGVVRGFFIKSIPDEVIDSWEDLHNRKDLKIATMEGSALDEFVEKECDTSEMAADFKSRMEVKSTLSITLDDIKDSMYGHDDYAVSFYDCFMNDCYRWLPKGRNKDDCEKFYVSKHGGVTVPYFLLLSYNMKYEAREHLNKIISRSIESGIYEKWLTETNNVRRVYYPEHERIHKPKIDSEVIRLESVSGVFVILLIGITISVAVLIMEIMFRCFNVSH